MIDYEWCRDVLKSDRVALADVNARLSSITWEDMDMVDIGRRTLQHSLEGVMSDIKANVITILSIDCIHQSTDAWVRRPNGKAVPAKLHALQQQITRLFR